MNKFALSFSGGGARSIGFLGFLRGLEEKGLKPDHLTAYSGGTWLLAALASNLSDEEYIHKFSKIKLWKYISLNPLKNGGLFNFKKFRDMIENFSEGKSIEDLDYDASIAFSEVTDPYEPSLVVKTKGSIAKYSSISSIIPPLFPLFEEEGKLYADGGYSTAYNSKYLIENGITKIIGFDSGRFLQNRWIGLIDGVARITRAVMTLRDTFELSHYPVPLIINGFKVEGGLASFSNAKELFDEGYNLALSNLDNIYSMIES